MRKGSSVRVSPAGANVPAARAQHLRGRGAGSRFRRRRLAKVVATPPRCREVFREIDPDFEAGSLDEAFLDVTDYCAARGLTGERSTEEKKGR